MADDEATTDATDTSTDAPETTTPDADEEILAAARDRDVVQRALQRERDTAKEAKRRADELAAQVAEFEDRDKTDQQKLTERASSAEDRASKAETKALRLEVALEKGLVGDRAALAARLQGNTKEELIADAEQLLALTRDRQETTFDGGARGTPPNQGGMDGLIRNSLGR